MMTKFLFSALAIVLLFTSCKKEKEIAPNPLPLEIIQPPFTNAEPDLTKEYFFNDLVWSSEEWPDFSSGGYIPINEIGIVDPFFSADRKIEAHIQLDTSDTWALIQPFTSFSNGSFQYSMGRGLLSISRKIQTITRNHNPVEVDNLAGRKAIVKLKFL